MKNLFLGLIVLISASLTAQSSFLAPYTPKAADAVGQVQKINPSTATYYSVSEPAHFADFLRVIPGEGKPNAGEESLLELPSPDGTVSTFRLTRYQMITDELQARYPHYVTAYGWDVDAPQRRIFLEWTDLGFAASVKGGEEGRWFVSPQFHQRQDLYQVYYTKNYPRPDYAVNCGFEPDEELLGELEAFGPPQKFVGDCELREYDLALACTGEYFAAVGGTEASVVAEMMTAINRVNEVFRSDLAITLKIINLPVVGGGIELVFTNPASDPYTNNDGGVMLGENQEEIDDVIGTANYDIGHVFSTGGGGIASLGSPCNSSRKAQGVTGLTNPIGDPFYIDFVAHEIGHQFGGNHTFNSTEGNCVQRNGATGYEPGGGTTIQAYAGICGPTANIQLNGEAYYHAISIQEISAYMELGGGSTCASTLSTANTAPTVNGGNDYVIPANTPFVLTATGSDPNGDALTYCWEQFDLGPVVAGVPTGNETSAPLFRSLLPTVSPERYFPNLPALVASGGAEWEVLPKVARNMTFIVTLRDLGTAGYGCTVQDQVEVDVVASAGFAVTAPNGGDVWQGGATETVTWNVAGTGDGTTVDCEMVEIVLSTNGGLTFDQSLGTFPNNGSADVSSPAITATDARIMVRCDGNIFFDVGDADFRIEQNDYSYTVTSGTATACNGQAEVDYSFELESLQGYTGTVMFSETNLPTGATVTYTPASVTLAANSRQTVNFVLGSLGALAAGDYTFQVVTNDGTGPKTEDYVLTVLPGIAAPNLITPAANGFLDLMAATFDWSDVPNAVDYEFQVCLNSDGTNCFGAQTFPNSFVNFGDSFDDFFDDGDVAYWQVTARNTNCEPADEAASGFQQFTWGAAPPTGTSLTTANSSLEICEGNTSGEGFTVNFFDGDLTGPATLSVMAQPAGLTTTITPTVLSNGESAVVSFTGEETLAPGSYTISILADDGTGTETIDFALEVLEDVINSPTDGEEVLLTPNPGCGGNDGAAFFEFNFNAFGGGTVVEYLLYREIVGGGFFSAAEVFAGVNNNFGLCLDEGDMLTFRVEAELADGTIVESCEVTVTVTEAPLPVEWLSFTASPLGKTSQLNWAVIQDGAHRAFTVERSDNGNTDWVDIATIDRVGANGNAYYGHNDATVATGTYFYRLRQQDVDGTTDHSVIRSVTFTADEAITAFPNPAGDWLTVQSGTDLPASLSYELVNALGQRVNTGNLTAGTSRIDLSGLPTAVYQLVVTDGKEVQQVIKVVKR